MFSEFLLNLAEFVWISTESCMNAECLSESSWTRHPFSESDWTFTETWLNPGWTVQTDIQKNSEYEIWLNCSAEKHDVWMFLNICWTIQKCFVTIKSLRTNYKMLIWLRLSIECNMKTYICPGMCRPIWAKYVKFMDMLYFLQLIKIWIFLYSKIHVVKVSICLKYSNAKYSVSFDGLQCDMN